MYVTYSTKYALNLFVSERAVVIIAKIFYRFYSKEEKNVIYLESTVRKTFNDSDKPLQPFSIPSYPIEEFSQ